MEESRKAKLSGLAENIPYSFKNIELFNEALIHTSYVNEKPEEEVRSYERLEFLGDAVLGLSIGHILMERDHDCDEGKLSKVRASLVNETVLAKLTRSIGLAEGLMLGKGERRSGGSRKRSILADLYESMVGAIYLDGGFECAFNVIKSHFNVLLEAGMVVSTWDYKSRLQEVSQHRFKTMPSYTITSIEGPDHKRIFEVELSINGDTLSCGKGRSKKEAEQDAAKNALLHIKK